MSAGARFGDFVALAAEHLADANMLDIERYSELYRKVVIAQLGDFCEVLLDIEQRFAWEAIEALPHRSATAASLFPPQVSQPADPRSELHMSLTEAVGHLRIAQGNRPTELQHPPQCLPRATQALRTGLDLLATHTGPDGSPLTRHGLALESDELRSAVLARVLPLTVSAATVADRLAASTEVLTFPRRAGALDESSRKLRVAHQQAQLLTAQTRIEGNDRALDALALRTALRADPPRTAETVEQLAAGAAASADRLAEFAWRSLSTGDEGHIHTAAAMGTAAANISAVYTLTRTLLAHAAVAIPEPTEQIADEQAWQAAERQWRQVAACWRPLRSAPDSVSSVTPVSAESHALVDRVGRLLFADPAWRLADGGDGPVRDLGELIDVLPTWTEALRHINGQLQHLAQDHASLTQQLADNQRLLMRASGPVHNRQPARPLSVERQAELGEEYQLARKASGATEELLADLTARIGVDPASRRLQHLAATPAPAAADRVQLRQSAVRLAEQGQPAQPPQRWATNIDVRFRRTGLGL